MLENSGEISIDLFRSTLDVVHAEGLMPTVYSNIYDLKNGEIYVFNFHNYNEVVKLNLEEQFKKQKVYGGSVGAATKIGELIANKAKDLGVKEVVFDRGGYLYHGRVKALADSARAGGLIF